MFTTPERVSLLTAGLDHWYERESADSRSAVDPSEYRVEEWRLQRSLGVSHFRLPPDYRARRQFGGAQKNLELTIPALRFPSWYVCRNLQCRALVRLPMTVSNIAWCTTCRDKGKRSRLEQVDFVAICAAGHLRDFPWYSWCHSTLDDPEVSGERLPCGGTMSFRALGGASLASQEVRCSCGERRRLRQITFGDANSSILSSETSRSRDEDLLCDGHTPWNGTDERGRVRRAPTGCGRPIVGALRTASNVYFSVVRSAIYLPRSTAKAPAELMAMLEDSIPAAMIALYGGSDASELRGLARIVKQAIGAPADQFSDEQVEHAIEVVRGLVDVEQPAAPSVASDDAPTAFRRTEFGVLREPQVTDQLLVRRAEVQEYGKWVAANFDRISLVDSLRETRAFVGFTRLQSGAPGDEGALRSLLRVDAVEPKADWLPAYVVHGEGIYLELNAERVRDWERRDVVIERAASMMRNHAASIARNGVAQGDPISITPRFLLLHALAHALLNRMTFDAGYSTAALRERIFASSDANAPMAGLLIYTAAGDAEGTMGGLVRLGRKDRLAKTIINAVDTARWCSADPVCMEISHQGGQGPDACNLAACHGCSLVAETACEHFNRFLDRGVLIGDPDVPGLGFFAD